MAVTARPPKKKFDDRPPGIAELSDFIDESFAKFGADDPDTDEPSPKVKHRMQEKAKKNGKPAKKKKKTTITVSARPKAVNTEARKPDPKPEPKQEQPKGKGKGKGKAPMTMYQMRSAMLATTIKLAQEEYGDRNILGAGDADRLVVGIPIPLAMQYVIQNNVFPLGRMIQLVGVEKTNKSGLGFEITRWFAENGGSCNLFENETKYSPDFAQSIFGYADELAEEFGGTGEVLVHYPCGTQQDWQQKLSSTTRGFKKVMTQGIKEVKGKKGKILVPGVKATGRIMPVLMLLDSITGGVAEEKQTAMENKGYAERNYAMEAMYNQDFLKKYRTDLIGWPFTLLVVNHLKKQKAESGPHIERKKGGGKHIGFQESLELEMTKVQSLKYVDDRPGAVSLDIKGNRINIKCQKSALGEEERSVTVDLLWWYDRSKIVDDPSLRQRSQWQWEAALIDLLLKLEGTRKEKAQDIVDLHKKSESEIWSRRLGIPKDQPVNKQEIGLLMEKDPQIVAQLSDLFAIKQRTVFHYGEDFKKLLGIESAKRAKKLND